MSAPCYLCGETRAAGRWPRVRDRDDLAVLECCGCGLVFLSSHDHVDDEFYERSQMHGGAVDFDRWRAETSVDDERRFAYCRPFITSKRVLDFGCGNAGFLVHARTVAEAVCGVEVERALDARFRAEALDIVTRVGDAPGPFDVITLFHALEHLKDPRATLRELFGRLAPGGRLIIEVPNADDALLGLYGAEAFKSFSYWSCHLFLFTGSTLRMLLTQAGAAAVRIDYVQRYPLSNHLYWLTRGEPGGHIKWSFLDTPALTSAYGTRLAALGVTDTIVADARLER